MRIAIVILNWNGSEMLRRFLPSVIRNSCDVADVYVADNASTDNSLTMLREHFGECKLIELDKNYGFAGGYNKALRSVDAEYYVLLNSDVEVTCNWLIPLISFMDSHNDVAACQPKLLSEGNRDYFEYSGACGGFIDKYGYPFCRGRIFDYIEKDCGQYDEPIPVLWATGACMMIRKEDYVSAGGFDESFFAHNEEIDLCWRLCNRGRKIYCIPQSKVYHVGGGTLPKGNPMKTFLNFRNNLSMLYKNLPDKELVPVMRMRCFLDYVASLQMLVLNRNYKDFKAVLKARKAFKRMIPELKLKRSKLMPEIVNTNISERKRYSLVWQYYIKGVKIFFLLPTF